MSIKFDGFCQLFIVRKISSESYLNDIVHIVVAIVSTVDVVIHIIGAIIVCH